MPSNDPRIRTHCEDSPTPPVIQDSIKEGEDSPPISWETHPENPFNWTAAKKWRQFLAGSLVTLLVGLNSTAIATPGSLIAKETHVNTGSRYIDHTVWPITAWNTGAAFGPMIGVPLLEAFGMRYGYLTTFALFFLFVIPQAVARSFVTLIVTRTFAGVFGGTLLNCLACFVADMWLTDAERDFWLTLFVLIYVGGVTLGPTFGALVAVLEWRWIFYVQLIIYGALFPLLLIITNETRGPVIRARLAKTNPAVALPPSPSTVAPDRRDSNPLSRIDSVPTGSTSSWQSFLYTATIRPFHMLFTEPIVAAFTLWSSFCFGIVYTGIQSIAQIYQAHYHFTDAQCGLLQVSVLIGLVMGMPLCLLQNAYYSHHSSPLIPERRLPASILASVVGLAGGLFVYAFASLSNTHHWIIPTLGLVLIGLGVQVVVSAVALYIADAYSLFAGSALSAVGFGENLMAAWLPLAARRMYGVGGLGERWASATLGFAALALTAAPICLVVWGRKVRDRSAFLKGGQGRYGG